MGDILGRVFTAITAAPVPDEVRWAPGLAGRARGAVRRPAGRRCTRHASSASANPLIPRPPALRLLRSMLHTLQVPLYVQQFVESMAEILTPEEMVGWGWGWGRGRGRGWAACVA